MSLPEDLTLNRLQVSEIFVTNLETGPPSSGTVLVADGNGGTYWAYMALSSQQSTLQYEVESTLDAVISIANTYALPDLSTQVGTDYSVLSAQILYLSASTVTQATFSTYVSTVSAMVGAQNISMAGLYIANASALSSLSASFAALSVAFSTVTSNFMYSTANIFSVMNFADTSTFSAAVKYADTTITTVSVGINTQLIKVATDASTQVQNLSTQIYDYFPVNDDALTSTISNAYIEPAFSICIASIVTVQAQLSTDIGKCYVSSITAMQSTVDTGLTSSMNATLSIVSASFSADLLAPVSTSIGSLSVRVSNIEMILSQSVSSISDNQMDVIGIYTQMATNQSFLTQQINQGFSAMSASFSTAFVSLWGSQNISGANLFLSSTTFYSATIRTLSAGAAYISDLTTGNIDIDALTLDKITVNDAAQIFQLSVTNVAFLNAVSIGSGSAGPLTLQGLSVNAVSAGGISVGGISAIIIMSRIVSSLSNYTNYVEVPRVSASWISAGIVTIALTAYVQSLSTALAYAAVFNASTANIGYLTTGNRVSNYQLLLSVPTVLNISQGVNSIFISTAPAAAATINTAGYKQIRVDADFNIGGTGNYSMYLINLSSDGSLYSTFPHYFWVNTASTPVSAVQVHQSWVLNDGVEFSAGATEFALAGMNLWSVATDTIPVESTLFMQNYSTTTLLTLTFNP